MPAHSSPKKKRTKCKVTDSDGQEISTKKSWAGAVPLSMLQHTPDVDSSLLPWHSGCPGIGTGGRANQLERISALLGAPAWTSQPKGSTSLDSNVPINPLALEPVHKDHGSQAKKPPPPYSASEPADPPAATSTKAKGKKAKAMKTAVIPPSSMKVSDVQPSFYQREAGARFGFSQYIIPLGTEPNLQVLNNPYMAAAREKQLDIFLLPLLDLQRKILYHRYLQDLSDDGSGQKDSGSDTSSEGSDTSTTDDEEDQEVGWGASKGYLTTHPGFSKEVLPPQPQVTTALPLDFEFQYSRDEDNDIALAVEDSASSDDDNQPVAIEPKPDDVLLHHQKKNRHPHVPNPEFLDLLQSSDTTSIKVEESETKATMAKAPRSKEPFEPKPTQLGWYPSRWKAFLEDAKGDCHTQHAIENAFPTLADDLPISVTEALTSSLVEWLEGSKQVEPGLWPNYKPNMAKLLYEDLSTWRSDLKKTTVAIAPTMRPDIFKKEILLNSLALICTTYHCVLDGFIKNGNGKLFPKFSAKEYSTIYQSMIALLEDVKNNPYHGPKLMQQLCKWAAEGWAESCKLNGRDMTKHNHLQVILD
ncbi:hypothetical protein BDR06DRAFT_977932 [Suillus hirtellus]|nr:hypothetical protein BDR06DRAFT_977932 [Suillus hirtellus]